MVFTKDIHNPELVNTQSNNDSQTACHGEGEAGKGIYILNNLTFTQTYPFKDERRN